MVRRWLQWLFLALVLVPVTAVGAPPKFLKNLTVDDGDPIQVLVYQVLESAPSFDAVLGEPFSEQDQQAYVERFLAQAKDKLRGLEFLEGQAPTLRHVSARLYGETATYVEIFEVQQDVNNLSRKITWAFPLSADDAWSMAIAMEASIRTLLTKNRKWKIDGGELPDGAGSLLVGQYRIKGSQPWDARSEGRARKLQEWIRVTVICSVSDDPSQASSVELGIDTVSLYH